jgi:hypothetical protein
MKNLDKKERKAKGKDRSGVNRAVVVTRFSH